MLIIKKVLEMFEKVKNYIRKKYTKIQPFVIEVEREKCLQNRAAVITGGGSGIGLAIAKAFVSSGCKVIITGRNEDKLQKAVLEINQIVNNSCTYLVLDNTCHDSFCGIFEKIEKSIGAIPDILVNNAGIIGESDFLKVTPNDFELVMKTNLMGPYFLSQHFCNYCIDKKIKSNILNIGSSSCLRPALSPYSISKWGIRGLTLGLAKMASKYDIVVNGIAPGPTATDILGKEISNYENNSIPCKRFITPEEVASLAVKMVSSSSRMIQGDMVYITGGAGNLTFDDVQY